MSLQVRVLESLAELEPLAVAWDRLAEEAPRSMASFGHAWVSAFVAHCLPPGIRWRVATAERDGALVGVLPLVEERAGLRGLLAPRLKSATDEHSFVGGPLLAAGPDREAVLRALLDGHLEAAPRTAAILFERTAHVPESRDVFPSRGRFTRILRPSGVVGCAFDTRGPWEERWKGLGQRTKKNLRNAENRLAEMGRVDHEVVRDAADVPAALEAFLALEAAGWKGREGTAIAQHPARRAFYEEACRNLAARGALRVHVLRLDGRPIAAELCGLVGRRLHVQKITYDETLDRLSPGHLLWQRTMRLAHESPDVDAVDTLYMDAIRERWNGEAYEYLDAWLLRRGLLPWLFRTAPLRLRERFTKEARPPAPAPDAEASA
jgi:CelD/BcsL family acetyltransferase involved in cellulose biosynthesis